jgi:fatty acid desaturase
MNPSRTHRNAHLKIEWPTLGVMGLCYGSYVGTTVYVAAFSPVLATFLLAFVIALHSSLQHEVLHGHPFKEKWLSELTVFPAIGLFIPYQRFRDTHLAHHFDPRLTDPFDDPESNYLAPECWVKFCRPHKVILRFNNLLFGRMLIGPMIGTLAFWAGDIRLIRQGDKRVIKGYIVHLAGLVPVIYWIAQIGYLSGWLYLLAAYAGLSILKIRTFLEHRAHESVAGRSVIIEDKGLLAFLFLNNNFHSVHHAHPQLAWYELPAFYKNKRDEFLRRNRAYSYANYGEVFRAFMFKTKDPVPHPLMSTNPSDRDAC